MNPTRRHHIPEMLFKAYDRLYLADLIAICQFSTEFSLALSLRHEGENEGVVIGWLDLHLTRSEHFQKIYFRICLRPELTTRNRIESLRQACFRALAIPDSANFEINLFWADKSVLILDDREGFIFGSGSGFTIPLDTPLLDFRFETQ